MRERAVAHFPGRRRFFHMVNWHASHPLTRGVYKSILNTQATTTEGVIMDERMIDIHLFYDERDDAYDVYANNEYVGQITNWDDDELRALGYKAQDAWGDEFTAVKIS